MFLPAATEFAPVHHAEKARRGRSAPVPFRLKEGASLFFEQDDAHSLYQVVSGILRLTRVTEGGHRQVIGFGYPGDVVGFPDDGRYQSDCDALCEAKVVRYRSAALNTEDPDTQAHGILLQAALHEISGMQDHIMMLGRKSALAKIASFLSVMMARSGRKDGPYMQLGLPMSRSDIADFLGLTTETVSRSLTELRKLKVIAIKGIHTVVVMRPNDLKVLSEG
jgi:CRP/FNR family transcriptional regulator